MIPILMHGRHHFAVGVEGQLAHAGHGLLQLLPLDPLGVAHIQQGDLGGVAQPLAIGNGSVVAQHKTFHKRLLALPSRSPISTILPSQ